MTQSKDEALIDAYGKNIEMNMKYKQSQSENSRLKKQLAVAVAALTTVSWYEKMKGLEGPALIAKDALSQIEEMGK